MQAKLIALVSLTLTVLLPPTAGARSCGDDYTVAAGDTLSSIAQAVYADPRKWTVLHQANIERLGVDPNRIEIGSRLSVPCLDGSVAPAGTTRGVQRAGQVATLHDDGGDDATPEREVLILTADDYKPFTDQSLPDGGLIAGIVDAAMARAPGVTGHRIDRINDWASHLDPLLSNGAYDMGFPWLRPDCDATPDRLRCKAFLFSEPMFEMLVLLFVNADDPIPFNEDADMIGRTLCRPTGYYTHDLDKDGRNWLADELITLRQADDVEGCFNLLRAGEVDAVAINEFTGRQAIRENGLDESVVAVSSRPLSIEGLYVLVNRNHPWGQDLIDSINQGLRSLKDSGDYQKIVDRHLTAFWAQSE
jgi:polar amino acid transport system substrate-binding protein